jgi:Calx-beta domain
LPAGSDRALAGIAAAHQRLLAATSLDVLGFGRHSFSVSEADPAAHVNPRRVGNAAGEISFHWYTFGDSAHAGQDYLFGTGQISMVRRQTTAVLEIPIVADAVPENPELLQA